MPRARFIGSTAKVSVRCGDRDKARTYYAKFIALTEKADRARPELQLAKAYLAQR